MSSAESHSKSAMPKSFKYGPRFASPVNSPSYEWRDDTQFLQVTRGCSHNKCRYCTFFKNVPYGKVDLEEVEFYLRFIANGDKNIPVKRIFLQGSNCPIKLAFPLEANAWHAPYSTSRVWHLNRNARFPKHRPYRALASRGTARFRFPL